MPSTSRQGRIAPAIVPIPLTGKLGQPKGQPKPEPKPEPVKVVKTATYTGGAFDHDHRCPKCNHLWGHDPDPFWMSGRPGGTEANIAAHTCPECGTEQWIKFYGEDGPPYGGWFNLDDKLQYQALEQNVNQREGRIKRDNEPRASLAALFRMAFGPGPGANPFL